MSFRLSIHKPKPKSRSEWIAIIKQLILLVFVIAGALLILIYVGYSDGLRVYTDLQLANLAANAELIGQELESRLSAGVPLGQIIGFQTLTAPIINATPDIASVRVVDLRNEAIFFNNQQAHNDLLESAKDELFVLSDQFSSNEDYAVYTNDTFYQVRYYLNDRFDRVGYLQILLPIALVREQVESYFITVFVSLGILLALFPMVYIVLLQFAPSKNSHLRIGHVKVNMLFGTTFVILSIIVLLVLVQIYSDGIQRRAEALSDYLANRINAALGLGLSLDDFEGIDTMLLEYQAVNEEISYITLVERNAIRIHTDSDFVGDKFVAPTRDFNYMLDLSDRGEQTVLRIGVGIPRQTVYTQLLRNIKNFVVLFLATVFVAWLLLRILYTIDTDRSGRLVSADSSKIIGLIYPVFFLANFMEGLLASFLPQYLQGISTSSGLESGSAVAAIFTCYFAAYALILVPAGRYAQHRGGVRRLLIAGALLYMLSMILLALVSNIYLLYGVRILAGLGQGIIFIATQSHILHNSDSSSTTENFTIIVYGYNGGIIAGSTIGGLLVVSIGQTRIFFLAAGIALLLFLYIWMRIPKGGKRDLANHQELVHRRKFSHTIIATMRDGEFLRTIFLVGIVAKAILTGAMFFILPIILEQQQYLKEDIAQILMFYVGGVLLASRWVAKITDRIGNTALILSCGSIGSGIGIVLIAVSGFINLGIIGATIFIIAGMFMTGLSHGFIHAPIITHIANTRVSNLYGKATVSSLYRFLERIGHVIGPIAIGGALFSLGNGEVDSLFIGNLGYVGIVAIIFGICFAVFHRKKIARNIE